MADSPPPPLLAFGTPRGNLAAFVVVLLATVWMERLPRATDGYFVFWTGLVVIAAWLYYLNHGPWLDTRRSIARTWLRVGLFFLAGWTLLFLSTFVTPEITEEQAASWRLTNLSTARIVVLVAFVPFLEELVFRGFLYGAVAVRGAVLAILVSSTADFAIHWMGHSFDYAVAILAGAVISGILRTWTRGLAASLLFHSSLNAGIAAATLLPN